MDAMECLLNRRSIRKYKTEQIKDSELDAVLKAGTYAPTGKGLQSPLIVVVQDPETIADLARLNNEVSGRDYDPFYGAPTLLIVFSDSKAYPDHDGSLVLGNLMNAAYAQGLGSCMIWRAKEVFEMEEGKAYLKKWGLPEDLRGIGHCILGYPDETPTAKPRKEGYIVKV